MKTKTKTDRMPSSGYPISAVWTGEGEDVLETYQANSRSYQVKRLQTETDFFALEKPLKELVSCTSDVPIFLTWEWIHTWWQHFKKGKEPWILSVWDEDWRLVGLAPWMLERLRMGLLSIRRVSFIGDGIVYPTHLDIIAGEDKGKIWTVFLEYLNAHTKEWDILDLKSLSESSPISGIQDGWYLERNVMPSPYIPLPNDWKTYEMTVLSRNRRWRLRRNLRELEQNYPGEVQFHQVTNPEELQLAIASLIELSKNRWHERGSTSSFENARFTAFIKEMANLALQKGWLRFYHLKVANQVIASRCCFLYEKRLYDYQAAYHTSWGDFTPGELLLAHVIQQAITEGVQELDLLTGIYRWKSSWSEGVRAEHHLLFSKNMRGRLWLLSTALFDRSVNLGKKILPSTLQQKIMHQLSEMSVNEFRKDNRQG